MTALQSSDAIPMKPIYSGPRPNVDRQVYEAHCNYLSDLVRSFSLRFYAPKVESEERINQLFKEGTEIRKLCDSFTQKARDLHHQLSTEAGDGTVIEDAREILDLLPPHRITSGPIQEGYHNLSRFKLAFRPELFPAIAQYQDKAPYALKQAIDIALIGETWLECRKCDLTFRKLTDDESCRQCNLPMFIVADQHKAARLENRWLQDRLLPLRERGFQTWITIEKVTKTNILATLIVSGR